MLREKDNRNYNSKSITKSKGIKREIRFEITKSASTEP
jgi:hypothetical protein